MSSTPVASVQHHLEAFRRHRGKAIGFFLLVVTSAVALLVALPGSYQSESALYVRLGRESVTLDPIASMGQTMTVSDSREYEINTVAEVLRNRGVSAEVVEKVGVDRLLYDEEGLVETFAGKGWTGNLKLQIARWLKWVRRSGPGTETERAQKMVTSGLDVHAIPKSSIITVRSSAETPELARDLNAALINEYLEQHLAMHQSQGSEEFLDQQAQLLRERLSETETRLRELKDASGILSIEGKRTQLQQQLDQVEQQRLRIAAQLAAAKAQVASLSQQLSQVPERVTTLETTGLPNIARDNMRQELYRLEIQLQDLLARKTEVHPDVISTKKQIDDARKILEESPDQRSQAATDVNKTYQSLSYDLMRQQALEASYQRELDELLTQREEIASQIDDVNLQQVQVEELQREQKLLAANYETYVGKLEQARIASELQKERISNVHVVQQPSMSSRPASPNKPLLLVAAILLGAIGSYLIVAVCEATDQQLHSPEAVEEELGIPVFASLPRTSRRHASLN